MLSSNYIIIPYSIYGVYLVDVRALKLHEECIKEHLEGLKEEILSDGVLKKPIIVDKNTMIVLDGTHRVTIAREVGFKVIPALLIDYTEAGIYSWARIFTGKNAKKYVIEFLQKMFKESQSVQGKNIVVFFNGKEYLRIKSSRSILEIYRTLYSLERKMLSKGFSVKIVPDYVIERYWHSSLVIVPPRIRREDVIRVVSEGKCFPPKSTRHVLKRKIPDVNIPLHVLAKGF